MYLSSSPFYMLCQVVMLCCANLVEEGRIAADAEDIREVVPRDPLALDSRPGRDAGAWSAHMMRRAHASHHDGSGAAWLLLPEEALALGVGLQLGVVQLNLAWLAD